MKKVLIVAYYFPPMGMGGVQRATKFVKYLPEFGWDPVVLTVKDVSYYARDVSMLGDVKNASVYRTGSLDPLRLHWLLSGKKKSSSMDQATGKRQPYLFNRLNTVVLSKFLIPDSKVLWLPHAIFRAGKIVKDIKPDLICTTSPPHSAHCVGWALKAKFGIPWIMDFRDRWFHEMYQTDIPGLHRQFGKWLYGKMSASADSVVAVSAPIAEKLSCLYKKNAPNVFVLPNGFDPSDFPDPDKKRTSDKFTFTYCGTFNAFLNPMILLKALQNVMEKIPGIKKRMQFVFAGNAPDIHLQKLIKEMGLSGLFRSAGYVSHSKSIQYLVDSDLLFFLLPTNAGPGMITGKIFEYLASGKPILAAVPDGEASDLLKRFRGHTVVSPDDSTMISDEIIRLFRLWEKGRLKKSSSFDKRLRSFDRRNQTGELAGLFDKVCRCQVP